MRRVSSENCSRRAFSPSSWPDASLYARSYSPPAAWVSLSAASSLWVRSSMAPDSAPRRACSLLASLKPFMAFMTLSLAASALSDSALSSFSSFASASSFAFDTSFSSSSVFMNSAYSFSSSAVLSLRPLSPLNAASLSEISRCFSLSWPFMRSRSTPAAPSPASTSRIRSCRSTRRPALSSSPRVSTCCWASLSSASARRSASFCSASCLSRAVFSSYSPIFCR